MQSSGPWRFFRSSRVADSLPFFRSKAATTWVSCSITALSPDHSVAIELRERDHGNAEGERENEGREPPQQLQPRGVFIVVDLVQAPPVLVAGSGRRLLVDHRSADAFGADFSDGRPPDECSARSLLAGYRLSELEPAGT
jgi:hypothetical protein